MGKKRATADGAPASSSSGLLSLVNVLTCTVLTFAIGFGGALRAVRMCASDVATTNYGGLLRFVCDATAMGPRATAPLKNFAVAGDTGAGAQQKRTAHASATIGAGGVGATDGGDPWFFTTHPGMATEGFNWTQLGMSRDSNFPGGDIKHLTAADVRERGAMWVWHTTFARSIPATVKGLASTYSDTVQHWTLQDYRKQWGSNKVTVAFSDHPNFNRGAPDPEYGRVVRHPDRQQRTFSEYLDLVELNNPDEHLSVQQSPSRDFAEFGLPSLPPGLEELVKYTLNARNFWAATPPKVSVLHYDWQDSVLLQISGTKRFTILDPAKLQAAYPCVAYIKQLRRVGPGQFAEPMITSREVDNFPLVNITHPDYERYPLLKEAKVFTVTLEPGDALLLPAYWYHQVDSYAPPDRLNVAVNFWFQGHSLATRLYRTIRENLFINCTEKGPAGALHPCRD